MQKWRNSNKKRWEQDFDLENSILFNENNTNMVHYILSLNILLILNVISIRVLAKRYIYNLWVTNGDNACAFIYSLPTFRNFRPLSLSRYHGTGTKCRIQQGEHNEENNINRITLKAMRGMQIDSVPIKARALSPDSFDYKTRISINKIIHNINVAK